jgi:chromosome segregation ATPase
MSKHAAYLDRMTGRLDEVEAEIRAMAQGQESAATVRELEASLASARERLQAMRRAGAELDEETTQSFAQSFERLNAAVGRARAIGQGRSDAA